jgi:hypothetical protein
VSQLECLPDKETLTVIVNPGGIDVQLGPSGEVEHGPLTSLVPNDEGRILGAVLRNYRDLESLHRSLTAAPGSPWPQRTGGNILKVSYNVLDEEAFNHQNELSGSVLSYSRRDPFKSRDIVKSLGK